MKKSFLAKFIWIIFIIILILGIGGLFFLPSLYDLFKGTGVKEFGLHALSYKIAFYSCYIICLLIVYQLTCLFKYIFKCTPFRKEVEKNLKISAILFMVLFVIIIIKAFFIPTLLSFAVAFVAFIASLSFYVLAEVIKAAIVYKNEVDYTV
ncbi:MAG: hypothetical protein HFI87_05425 [Bacilli bacterium]|nr:hypothetical protein [Bacilli bacterium]